MWNGPFSKTLLLFSNSGGAVTQPLAMMISVMLDRLIELTRSNAQRGAWSDLHWNSSRLVHHLSCTLLVVPALSLRIYEVFMRAILLILIRSIRP